LRALKDLLSLYMKKNNSDIYILDHFEGKLNFLYQLVQKSEIEITDIPLKQLIVQFLGKYPQAYPDFIEEGAEFIGTTSALIWWKSKRLLPANEQIDSANELESELDWDIIPQIIDYCRFKQMAKELSQLEHQQSLHYFRGTDPVPAAKKNLGVDHLSLEDLAAVFKQIVAKADRPIGHVADESWKVSDKIAAIRLCLQQNGHMKFEDLFSSSMSRTEMVVTFLALLELMKMGELSAYKSSYEPLCIMICRK
jgi:segregation and condensation protein A